MIGPADQAIPPRPVGPSMKHLQEAQHAAATQNRAIGARNKGLATPLPRDPIRQGA